MSMEVLGSHETCHTLGYQLFEKAETLLTAENGLRNATNIRSIKLPVLDEFSEVFESLYGLRATKTYLEVSDHSLGVSFELIKKGMSPHKKHPYFLATNLRYRGDLETNTGLAIRQYEGPNFKIVPVQYMDENYRKIEGLVEMFIPKAWSTLD